MDKKMVYVAYKGEKIESVIGEVENRHGAVLNSLFIDLWLSEQEAKGHDIEYICREAFYARNRGIDKVFGQRGGDLDATL